MEGGFQNETFSERTLLNITGNFTEPKEKAQFLLYDVLIPSIGAIVIILNLVVVISSGLLLKRDQQPRSTYLFLGNVAMADLITGIAVIFGQVFPIRLRNHNICSLQIGMIVASTLASVYSVGLIAIDRYLYILYGMKYQKWVYPARARTVIALAWLLGCIIGFLPLMGWSGNTNNGKFCWFILLAPKYLIVLTVALGAIPILVVTILYLIILYHAIKKVTQLQTISDARNNPPPSNSNLRTFIGRPPPQSEPGEDETKKKSGLFAKLFLKKPLPKSHLPKKMKAIKVVLFTTLSFIVTWVPYFVVSLYYVFTCESNESKRCRSVSLIIASPLAILGFANSVINPIIYAWWHNGFRKFVKKRMSTIRFSSRRTTSASVLNLSSSGSKTTKSVIPNVRNAEIQ